MMIPKKVHYILAPEDFFEVTEFSGYGASGGEETTTPKPVRRLERFIWSSNRPHLLLWPVYSMRGGAESEGLLLSNAIEYIEHGRWLWRVYHDW
jgi:hypothetical protein